MLSHSIFTLQNGVARYEHLTQTIHLNRVSEEDLKKLAKILNEKDFKTNPESIGLCNTLVRDLIHELRHWMDMNCSVYGLEVVNNILELQHRLVHDNAEIEKNHPAVKKLKLCLGLKAFVESNDDTQITEILQCKPTISIPKNQELKDMMHWSLVFSEQHNESIRIKSPIFLGSMLECNATFQEYVTTLALLENHDSWCVEKNLFVKSGLSFINDGRLVEYHSIAHALAVAAKQDDILEVFKFSSFLCSFLLHFPSKYLPQCISKAKWFLIQKLKLENVSTYINQLSENFPRETLLFCILEKIRLESKSRQISLSSNLLYDLMPCLNIGEEVFKTESHKEFCDTLQKIATYSIDYFQECGEALTRNNKHILKNIHDFSVSIFELERPPIFCNDTTIPGQSDFSNLEDYYMWVKAQSLEKIICIKT